MLKFSGLSCIVEVAHRYKYIHIMCAPHNQRLSYEGMRGNNTSAKKREGRSGNSCKHQTHTVTHLDLEKPYPSVREGSVS
jgi:hypothetical protein